MKLLQLDLSGSDCHAFLQRQLTADLDSLPDNATVLTAWCNIQGRALALFWLQKTEHGASLYIPEPNYAQIMPRLKMFVLRDDVQFSEPQACNGSVKDGQFYSCPEPIESWPSEFIAAGIPHLETEACAQYLPQMLNLDCLGGLSFNKGCYPGQEIVARTHFRGKLKQRCLGFNYPGHGGDTLFNKGGDKAGTVLLGDGQDCLAVIRLEQLGDGIYDADGEALPLLTLPYAIPELAPA